MSKGWFVYDYYLVKRNVWLDKGIHRANPMWDSEVSQSFCADGFHALLGQPALFEGLSQMSLVGCHVNTSDSPFLDVTIEAKTSGREPWEDFLCCT